MAAAFGVHELASAGIGVAPSGSNRYSPSVSCAQTSPATGSVSSAQYRPGGSADVTHTSWRRSPGTMSAKRSSRSGDTPAPSTSARKAAEDAATAIGIIGA